MTRGFRQGKTEKSQLGDLLKPGRTPLIGKETCQHLNYLESKAKQVLTSSTKRSKISLTNHKQSPDLIPSGEQTLKA